MITQELATIANHPEVCIHFPASDTHRYHFARWYCVAQEQATELLSLLEMIEEYRTMRTPERCALCNEEKCVHGCCINRECDNFGWCTDCLGEG